MCTNTHTHIYIYIYRHAKKKNPNTAADWVSDLLRNWNFKMMSLSSPWGYLSRNPDSDCEFTGNFLSFRPNLKQPEIHNSSRVDQVQVCHTDQAWYHHRLQVSSLALDLQWCYCPLIEWIHGLDSWPLTVHAHTHTHTHMYCTSLHRIYCQYIHRWTHTHIYMHIIYL